jgi:aspartate aminotransferase
MTLLNPSIAASMGRSSWIRRMFEVARKLKAEVGEANVCDFSLGNPHLEPPAEVIAELKRLAHSNDLGQHRYMTTAGLPEVRTKIAEHVSKREGVSFTADQIVMTCGAAGAINVAMRTLLGPGDKVALFTPCFAEYRFYCLHAGAEPLFVPTDGEFDLDADRLANSLTPDVKMVILNSPNNPTGRVYPEESVAAVCEVLKRKSDEFGKPIVLLVDDPYRKIIYDGAKVPNVFAKYPFTMMATSFSKDLGLAGQRIGYLAIHPEFPQFADVLEGLCFCLRTLGFVNAPALMQRVAAASLDASVDVHAYQRNRDRLLNGLHEIGYECVKPEGAFFLFPKAPGGDDLKFLDKLIAERILVVPGVGFETPGYFRISYAVDPAVVERSLPAFKRAFSLREK